MSELYCSNSLIKPQPNFRGLVMSVSVAFSFGFGGISFADDNQQSNAAPIVQGAVTNETNIEILPDAQGPADAWVHGNTDRVAISVSLGDANRGEMISNLPVVMDYQFAQRGKTGIEYFWEDGGAGATVFVIHSDAYVAEPLTFVDPAKVVSAIDKVVKLSNSKSKDFASALDVRHE